MSADATASVEVEPARSAFELNATRVAAAAGVCALWLLSRPYGGIRDDAALYMGKVLAELAPTGVGRDYLFSHDGQFGFSLFPAAARALTSLIGLSNAALVLSLGGLLLWSKRTAPADHR